jgi:hypothetical protein
MRPRHRFSCAKGNASLIRTNPQFPSFFPTGQLDRAEAPIPFVWGIGGVNEPRSSANWVGRGFREITGEGITLAKTKKAMTVAMDQRNEANRRTKTERRVSGGPVPVERRLGERREKVNRRRQIDHTTCERDYTDAEVEFMHALDQYKRASGRMFPTCSEVLEVLRGLGYEKHAMVSPSTGEMPNETEPRFAESC